MVAKYDRWECTRQLLEENFRMSKDSFHELAAELVPYVAPKPASPNYRLLDTEKKLAVTLCYLKDTGSLWMTANTFGIHQCTASKTIATVCTAICTHLGPQYLHLPLDKNEMRRKTSEFELKFGMTQAFGCMDGTHIPLKRPCVNSQDYFNFIIHQSILHELLSNLIGSLLPYYDFILH